MGIPPSIRGGAPVANIFAVRARSLSACDAAPTRRPSGRAARRARGDGPCGRARARFARGARARFARGARSIRPRRALDFARGARSIRPRRALDSPVDRSLVARRGGAADAARDRLIPAAASKPRPSARVLDEAARRAFAPDFAP